jgi:hypothetical protein
MPSDPFHTRKAEANDDRLESWLPPERAVSRTKLKYGDCTIYQARSIFAITGKQAEDPFHFRRIEEIICP